MVTFGLETPEVGPQFNYPTQNFPHTISPVVTIADLPYIARPITEYIHDFNPDVVVANDRGGRFLGLAVYNSWGYLYPDEPFPTADGRLHFEWLNKETEPEENLDHRIQGLLQRAGAMAVIKSRQEQDDSADPLKVMLLDDWIVFGEAVSNLRFALARAKLGSIELRVGTMFGHPHSIPTDTTMVEYVDIRGYDRIHVARTTWTNLSSGAGIKYPETGPATPIPRNLPSRLYRELTRDPNPKETDKPKSLMLARRLLTMKDRPSRAVVGQAMRRKLYAEIAAYYGAAKTTD